MMTKRLGASGGVAWRQLLIRSVRSSTSSISASRPTASADTCSTAKAGRAAICRVASTSQRGALLSGTARFNTLTASHDKPANTAAAVALEKQKKQEKTEEAQILAEDADVGAGEVADTFADYEVLACVGA